MIITPSGMEKEEEEGVAVRFGGETIICRGVFQCCCCHCTRLDCVQSKERRQRKHKAVTKLLISAAASFSFLSSLPVKRPESFIYGCCHVAMFIHVIELSA